MNIFHLIFPCANMYFFVLRLPLPPISFLVARPSIMNMHNIFTCLIYVNGEYPLFINVNCAMHARRLKGERKGTFLPLKKFYNYRFIAWLSLLLFTCIRGLLIIQSALSWQTPLYSGHLELVPAFFFNSLYLTLYKADIYLIWTLSGRSHWGTQRRFPLKCIQNTF